MSDPEPSDVGTRAAPPLVMPAFLDALDAWRADPTPAARDAVEAAVARMAAWHGISDLRLDIEWPSLPSAEITIGSGGGDRHYRLSATADSPLGHLRVGAGQAAAGDLAHALELALDLIWSRQEARRSARHLAALDAAVRGIAGVLDVDRVLQLIVDQVRDLAGAEYAALGIVGDDGEVELFITSGISREQRARIGNLPRGHGLLGLIIRENRSFRIRDIAADRRRHGFPPHHPEMHSFLGVPIAVGGRSIGNLYLTNKRGDDEFRPDDQALVEMFAMHAGIAIENARLHGRVQRLAVVDERERISKDLHDGIIQSIYGVTLSLDDLDELLDEDREEARNRVDRAIDALHGVIRDIRNFIFGLRPLLLQEGGLATALETLADELRANVGIVVEVRTDPSVEFDLPMESTGELLAIVREALSNVARHAFASRAEVELSGQDATVRLAVGDDGRGFDPQAQRGDNHHGLANMRDRAMALGGTMTIESQPSRGTRIIVTVPRPVDVRT